MFGPFRTRDSLVVSSILFFALAVICPVTVGNETTTRTSLHFRNTAQQFISRNASDSDNVLDSQLSRRAISILHSSANRNFPALYQLPTSIIFEVETPSVWALYRGRIIALVILILSQTILIAILLIERSRRLTANRKLKLSQENLFKTFMINPHPMALTTMDEGRYLDVNESFLRVSGSNRDEILGRTAVEFGFWENAEARSEMVSKVRSRSLRNLETTFHRKDGSHRVLLSAVEELELNGQACLLLASTDITERKVAEDRFRRFFDLPLIGMAILAADRHVLLANQTLCQMLGYSEEQLQQLTWTELTYPDDLSASERLMEQTSRGLSEGYVIEKRLLNNGGGIVYASISACCVRLADGTFDQLVLIVQDVTERKKSEQRLAELTARLLKTQDDERRRIARDLHDDTAQAIGVILLNLARVKKSLNSADQKAMDRLNESMALASQSLKEIRTLSYVLHPPLLDQAGLSTALQWYVKGFEERSGVKVKFLDEGSGGRRMPSDVECSLFRVVQECLTNIRRHTNSETAKIRLTTTKERVVLQVRDEGTTLNQSHSTAESVDEFEGLGVGIPGMKHRLKQLGGDLQVQSAAKGTIVTATVPVRWSA